MTNLTISIFGNKVFPEILKELNLFSKTEIVYIESIDSNLINKAPQKQIVIFFLKEENISDASILKDKNFPSLLVIDQSKTIKIPKNIFTDQVLLPFKAINFKNKINAILARHTFKESSIIKLGKYIINKNERKIKKNNLELKLTEKEIDFLILFTSNGNPISKNFILKNIWKYSTESDTHTVETHIHRLRKKIFEKFNDNDFIKNNNKGYFI